MSPDLLPLLVLLLAFLGGLVLVPFGLPGLWIMLLGIVTYAWWTDFRTVGGVTIAAALGLALTGELIEAWLGFRYARRYGGSSRAGWGAIVGGAVGAVVGLPVPLVGSVLGAFAGAFAGAALFELAGARSVRGAWNAGWGALLGRIGGTAVKIALGLVIAVITLFAVFTA